MTTVALLPARGGSKRIPRKNVREFAGVPILGRTIRIVEEAGLFDRIIVSTDDDGIALVARDFGAEVVERSSDLADDYTGLLGVVQGELGHILGSQDRNDVVACVLPTAVLMAQADLSSAVVRIREGENDFVVAVGRFSYPIQRALRMQTSGQLEMAWPENYFTRSQDLEPMFHDAGQFYVGTVNTWLHRRTMFEKGTHGLQIADLRVLDIDTNEDWIRAERMWETLKSRGNS